METDEEITEEQRKRAEANRLAALAKRKSSTGSSSSTAVAVASRQDPWMLFKCRKLSSEIPSIPKFQPAPAKKDPFLKPQTPLPEKFRAWLEISSPDSFSVTPVAIQGFKYPGDTVCMKKLSDCLLDVVPSHYTQNSGGGKACVYKLRDYDMVVRCLRNSKGIETEEIPWGTFNVVERLSHSFTIGRWEPCRPEHLSDDKVDELIEKLPKSLLEALRPFQFDGVRFGLRRGGRCLIADEMGLGKTLQAIAIAGCFISEGPILVVCPAILRFTWAEEVERWLPFCLPADIHLVFGHQNNPANLARIPKVVVTSYTMLHHLRKSILEREWALLIIDESHHVRCTKKPTEAAEIQAVLDLATKVKRIVLLSGTPSLSRPGLLGKNKYEFAKVYCGHNFVQGSQGKFFQDFSKGVRLEELHVLLKQSVMIRRLKEHVLVQLPPKRRQIVRLLLKRSDMVSARAAISMDNCNGSCRHCNEEKPSANIDEPAESCDCCICSESARQILGIAKLSGFCEWLSIHPIMSGCDSAAYLDSNIHSHKMIIFAHHLKVLDGIQEFISEKGIGFVRIDGSTLARDRQSALLSFKLSTEVKIAIIGLLVGAVGVDFSVAQHVSFLELPQNPAIMQQAEDRAHRHGQINTVNIYIFCAKDTSDESHWQKLNKSLRRVSSTTNGKYDAIHEIAVEDVFDLERSKKADGNGKQDLESAASCELSCEPLKFSNSALAGDKQLCEAYDETAIVTSDKVNEQCEISGKSTQKQDLQIKADRILKLANQKGSFSEGQLGKKDSGAEIERAVQTSVCQLDEGQENHIPWNKADSNFHYRTESDKDGSFQQVEAERIDQANFLRFEVSQYTGRIHLYSCIPGTDSRPRPLFVNFRLEDIDLLDSPAVNEKSAFKIIKENPSCRDLLLAFVNEWNNLRPIEQRKLLRKPLQLPLAVELCYLEDSINHNSGGLLKCRSKRRTTPLSDISHPLPADAAWRKVHISGGYGRKDKEYTQGWTLSNEPLCKLCQTPCKSSNAMTPEFFEDLFCNLGCYEEFRLRTSNRFLRQELFQIEHGVCATCQLDCHKLVRHIKPLPVARRQKYIEKVAPNIAKQKKLLDKLVNDPIEGNAWHADHIVPVYRGGGECRLENMRTLCVACHFDVTAAQRVERNSTRTKAKKQLKVLMSDLRNGQGMKSTGGTDTSLKEQGKSTDFEDELLIKVPGSAYSREERTIDATEGLEKEPQS